jgi:hypothetical protein
MFPFFKKWVSKKEIPKPSKINIAANEYRTLKLESLQNVFSSDMSIVQIRIWKGDIETYSKFLLMLINAFKEDRQLTKLDTVDESKVIFLRDFFLDRNQNFLDAPSSMQTFSLHAAEFLEIYQAKEFIPEPSFIIQSNLRLSGSIVSNLISLMESLKTL